MIIFQGGRWCASHVKYVSYSISPGAASVLQGMQIAMHNAPASGPMILVNANIWHMYIVTTKRILLCRQCPFLPYTGKTID